MIGDGLVRFSEEGGGATRPPLLDKYALGLELTDPGFHYSVLTEFRQRLIEHGSERILLEKLLQCCADKDLLKGKHQQRTDSTHVIAAVRSLTLLELAGETMRYLLNELARRAPDWLRVHIPAEWIKRYEHRFELYRLPKSKEERDALAVQIGSDGFALLKQIFAADTPAEVQTLPLVEIMRRIGVQQFYRADDKVHWRTKKEWGQPPANLMISSPHDLDIHYCVKRSTEWTGFKVHFTETCDSEQPRLCTHVETTTSPTHDVKVTKLVQEDLVERGLQPEIHLVDEGYMETNLLLNSQKQGINLVGPVPSHKSWQSRSDDAFNHPAFAIDWAAGYARCPGGKTSAHYTERKTWRGTPNVLFAFRAEDCRRARYGRAVREQKTRVRR